MGSFFGGRTARIGYPRYGGAGLGCAPAYVSVNYHAVEARIGYPRYGGGGLGCASACVSVNYHVVEARIGCPRYR